MTSTRTKSEIFRRFARAYLGALVFATIIIAIALIAMAWSSINQVEVEAMQSAATHMAEDMQLQGEIMAGVRDRILVMDEYKPNVLYVDKYKEIEMLDSLAAFVNHSPISSSLFLMYPGEDMIYTSSRTKAAFRFHFASEFSVPQERSGQLQQDLYSLTSMQILSMEDYGGNQDLLFALPVSFTRGAYHERAVLVFEVERKRLMQRMESVTGYDFAHYAVFEGEALRLAKGEVSVPDGFLPSAGQTAVQPLRANEYLLSATSMDGRFSICARRSGDAFARTLSAYSGQIIGFVVLLTIVFVAFAFAAAARTSRPIRQLAQRFGRPDERGRYKEFEILENAILAIELDRKASVRSAREQFLQLLLHGNGSAKMLEQWAQLGVNFDQPNNCVYIVSLAEGMDAAALVEEMEGFADSNLRIYAMRPADRPYVVACCSYRYDSTRGELFDNLCALIDEGQEKVFMGGSYATPLKLPVSYHEAKEARRTESSYSQQLGEVYEQVNQRLETIRTAARCGRVDVVEAEIEQLGVILNASEDSIALQKYIHHSLLSCMVTFLRENQKATMTRTMESMLVTDFRLFSSEFVRALRENQPVLQDDNPSVVGDILKYIARNASDCDLCLDMLADEFALSADYISQLVKAQTGVAFKEYLIRMRMQLAQKLLLERMDLNINEVANLSGYRASSNFIKRFRDTTGMTPVQFRKSREIPGDD